MKIILQIILAARRALSVDEMAIALRVESLEDNKLFKPVAISAARLEHSLRQCYGLFVPINHSRIYLIYQTVPEFLLFNPDSLVEAGVRYHSWKN